VIHIGTCGLHIKNKNCSPNDIVAEVESILRARQKELFPKDMLVAKFTPRKLKVKMNGGWGDVRDHQLCSQYSLNDDRQILKTNANFVNFAV